MGNQSAECGEWEIRTIEAWMLGIAAPRGKATMLTMAVEMIVTMTAIGKEKCQSFVMWPE